MAGSLLLRTMRSLGSYQELLADLRDGVHLSGLGLPRAARLPVLAALQQDLAVPVVLITSRADRALTLLDELGFWAPETTRQHFPEPNPLFYERASWGAVVRRERLQALTGLAAYHLPGLEKPATPPVLVAPVRAVMARTLPRRDFLQHTRMLSVNKTAAIDELVRRWVDIGYQPSETVVEPGQFSRRGGILDIWPPASVSPVRLEFFGDEIDTLRSFDPSTQRTIHNLQNVMIGPAREYLPGKAAGMDWIEEGRELDEFDLPRLHPSPASVLDYLPRKALIVVDDLDLLAAAASEVEEQAVRFRQESIAEGTLSEEQPVPYLSWSEVQDQLTSANWLELGRSTAGENFSLLAQAFTPGGRFGGRLKPLLDAVGEYCQHGEQVVIVSRQSPRLQELWKDRESFLDLVSAPQFVEGMLTEGWTLSSPEVVPTHLFTDSEVFGWDRPKPRQKRLEVAEAPEASYADLEAGDWVVHVDYGIGRFAGLVTRVMEGVEREFLRIDYDQGDQLFVPVHQADRISRYIGADGSEPHSTRLGTGEWGNATSRTRQAVMEIASDLLELYANRQVSKGHAFSADVPWQQEMEASFPYIETDDQLLAIANIKHDMESPRPMDRLLCGDVGYGKTEVALRAAFKAVMDGKQVALLVPTTVLAQQHYETFRQRLAAYPVEVEMLSRFRTPKQQDEILKRVRNGAVDIVIGTHRLVQSDVGFQDLGLVIIDEEQRFGVTHKEYLKKMRQEVDVLTMTATPIPRTLYMALTGVRDISMIATPPEERLPVITHIGPYSKRLIRQALLRELERGGQIFFVHNRVQTIEAMRRHLARLVPEVRIGIGHGQMPENELSHVMEVFTKGDIDVLLCTSIIESGLDIPNANTLIVDRADTFGLAQLYQLRGRVGRGAQRAYAYFFRHKSKSSTPQGLERLEVIAENTQLGAGYSIAMRDLEMRGAGEFLGTRQHGYIAAVGFHLYTRLLGQAVRDLRRAQGLEAEQSDQFMVKDLRLPVSVELPTAVGIPLEYVPEQRIRLQLYRRLADMQSEEDVDALAGEFDDRFGPMPAQTRELLYQMKVKLRGEKIGLNSISMEGDQIVLRFPPLPKGITSRHLPEIGWRTRTGKNSYRIFLKETDDWQPLLLDVLEEICNTMGK